MKKLFKSKKSRLIHINYSDWSKDQYNNWYTVGTVRDDKNLVLMQYLYYPVGFGAVIIIVGSSERYFISKLEDFSYADAFISNSYGALDNGHSLTELISKYIN